MDYSHVMIDLETLDTRPTAAIIAIGAVIFHGEGKGREFYAAIDSVSSVRAGLTTNERTVKWWGEQSAEARKVFTDPDRLQIYGALKAFAEFLPPDARVWGNGAAFDNAILANAYAELGIDQPWKFWNDRCYRTLAAISPAPRVQRGTHHNALDDAKSQAEHLLTFAEGFLA